MPLALAKAALASSTEMGRSVSIQVDSFGGDGGTAVKLNYTVNFIGDPVVGTFNPTTKVFTPNP